MPDEILDLSDVVVGDFVIRNRTKTREWRVDNDLPCRTAWALLTYGDAWDSGSVDQVSFDATMDALAAILKRQQPEVTRDDVIDEFSVVDVQRVIRFLQGRVGQLPEQEAAATPPAEDRDPTPITTPITPSRPSSSTEPTRTPTRSRATSGKAS